RSKFYATSSGADDRASQPRANRAATASLTRTSFEPRRPSSRRARIFWDAASNSCSHDRGARCIRGRRAASERAKTRARVVWDLHHHALDPAAEIKERNMRSRTKSLLASAAAVAVLGALTVWAQEPDQTQFVSDAVRGNLAEIRLGDLAQQRGQSQEV